MMTKSPLSLFFIGLLLVSPFAQGLPAAGLKDPDRTRTLTGQVVSQQNQPVHRAIVYLKNTRSLVVKTYISDADGGYHFLDLAPNVDYEVYAESNGARSDTKTLSAFDTRNKVSITLRIK
jgi:hypothetical protein